MSESRRPDPVRNPNPLCGTDWGRLLEDEFAQPYWAELMTSIDGDRSLGPVYPPASQVFHALELTWFESTKVVILGQDPYPTPGKVHGLSFSVPCGVRRPFSLARIHSELGSDVGVPTPNHGSLAPWAHRGVLLLNTTLTVRDRAPGSHRGMGWERFTDKVLEVVARERDPVFLLMGKEAQRKAHNGAPLWGSPNVVEAPQPRYYTFRGSRPYSRVNRRLRELGRGEMDWGLEP
jgi:uracil-DNA glycosylase